MRILRMVISLYARMAFTDFQLDDGIAYFAVCGHRPPSSCRRLPLAISLFMAQMLEVCHFHGIEALSELAILLQVRDRDCVSRPPFFTR